MITKNNLKISKKYSINFDLPIRSKKKLKFIIIHYTGMKKESDAIKKLCSPKSKVSAHYYIKTDGKIINLVPDLYVSWHAGKSKWKNFQSLNKNSIGIEITNPGHDNGYRKFTKNQILSLKKLLRLLIKKYKIDHRYILGHSDISPDRKKDPGEKFPWDELAKNKLCLDHKLSHKGLLKLRGIYLSNKIEQNEFLKNIYKIGYNRIGKKKSAHNTKLLIKAFQRRFRQGLIDGKIDKECLIVSRKLLIS